MREGYKDTPIGMIPEEWDVVKLGEIGEFKNGINKSKEDFGYGFPFINLMDVFGRNVVSPTNLQLVNASENELKEFNLIEGDVLFVRSSVKPSGVGLTALVKENLTNTVFSGFLIRYRDDNILNAEFKRYCFYEDGFRKRLIEKSTVSANTNINQVALKSLYFSIPLPTEQSKIASILSTVDDKIDTINERITQTRQLKNGLMQRLLTKGIGHTKFKDSPLGKIPESWHVIKFGETCNNITEKYSLPNGKCIDLENVEQGTGRIIGYDEISDKSSIKNHFKSNDILFGKLRPYLRKYCLTEFEGACTSEFLIFRSNKNYDTLFLFFIVQQDQFIQNAVSNSFGTKMPRTNWKTVSDFLITAPPISEQIEIADIFNTIIEKLDVLLEKKTEYEQLKKGLMQQLLTGKIRVKLN
ncbi:MAG: restriction endonuclease subunit S [Bacteroidetes bacterium]|nr:restriction endonuclease subunit S [Bacteroidota bacterium]